MADKFTDDTLLARWLSGDLSPEEARAFADHPDRAAYERLARAGSELRPPVYDAESELEKLLGRRGELKAPQPAATVRSLSWYRALSAAAVVLLLLTAGWFLLGGRTTTYTAGAGELTTQQLSDGSTVRLNAGSELTFGVADERIATLAGEAFFEVDKSATPFIVSTDLGEVRVLGTSFNVYARDGVLRVACRTGWVRVTTGGSSYELRPGQAVATDQTTPGVHPLTSDATDWLEGRSEFRSAPLAEAIREIERQLDLEVVLPAGFDDSVSISTAFGHNDQLDDVLKSVFPMRVTFEQDGRRVTVRPE